MTIDHGRVHRSWVCDPLRTVPASAYQRQWLYWARVCPLTSFMDDDRVRVSLLSGDGAGIGPGCKGESAARRIILAYGRSNMKDCYANIV
jgi:hypothetical protein